MNQNPSPLFEMCAGIVRDHAKLQYGIDVLPSTADMGVLYAPTGIAPFTEEDIAARFPRFSYQFEADIHAIRVTYKNKPMCRLYFDEDTVTSICGLLACNAQPIMQKLQVQGRYPHEFHAAIMAHLETYAAIRDLEAA
jgi:hypothetical protein